MSVYSVAVVFYGEFRFGCWECYQIMTHSDQFFPKAVHTRWDGTPQASTRILLSKHKVRATIGPPAKRI